MRLHIWLASFLLGLFMSAHAAVDTVGTVTAVRGEVKIIHIGKNRPAKVGDPLYKADKIVTGPASEAQLLFKDRTMITIGSQSRMRIADYLYDKRADSRTDFHLAKGFFRVLTGKIGKVARKNFKLKTANATIGIRGTEILIETDPQKGDNIACVMGRIVVVADNGQIFDVPAGKNVKISAFKSRAAQRTTNASSDIQPFHTQKSASKHQNLETLVQAAQESSVSQKMDDEVHHAKMSRNNDRNKITTPGNTDDNSDKTSDKSGSTNPQTTDSNENSSNRDNGNSSNRDNGNSSSNNNDNRNRNGQNGDSRDKNDNRGNGNQNDRPRKDSNGGRGKNHNAQNAQNGDFNFPKMPMTFSTGTKGDNDKIEVVDDRGFLSIGFEKLDDGSRRTWIAGRQMDRDVVLNYLHSDHRFRYEGSVAALVNGQKATGHSQFNISTARQTFQGKLDFKTQQGPRWIVYSEGKIAADHPHIRSNLIKSTSESEVKIDKGMLEGDFYGTAKEPMKGVGGKFSVESIDGQKASGVFDAVRK